MVRKAYYSFILGLVFLTPGPLFSLGLGDIAVDSALNQPLQAHIFLVSARPEELEELSVELAPADVFERVGVPRPYFLTKLNFEPISLRDGRAAIKVTSKDPVREPFLTFLIELTWPKGRLLREYTVLLDPPEFAQKKAPKVEVPAESKSEPAFDTQVAAEMEPSSSVLETNSVDDNQTKSEGDSLEEVTITEEQEDIDELRSRMDRALGIDHTEPVLTKEVTEEASDLEVTNSEPTAEELEKAVIKESEEKSSDDEVAIAEDEIIAKDTAESDYNSMIEGDEYTTANGDTLSKIARETLDSDAISVNQMMLAIQQANPDAFIQNNINLLKTGVVLRIPSELPKEVLTREQAIAEVSRQNSLWREYRAQVSEKMIATNVDAPGIAEESKEMPSELATEAELTLKEEEQKPAESQKDLSIMASGDSAETPKAAPAQLQVAGGNDVQALQQELVLSKELIQSREKENEELKSRIQALESILDKKDKILNIQNQQLEELKNNLTTETEKANAAERALQEQGTDEPAATSQPVPSEPQVKLEEATSHKIEAIADADEPSGVSQKIFKPKLQPLPDWDTLPEIEQTNESPQQEINVVTEAQTEEPQKTLQEELDNSKTEASPLKPIVEAEDTVAKVSAIEKVKENWTMFAAVLGVIAITLGFISIRRRKSAQRLQAMSMGMPGQLDDDQFDDILDETIVTPQDSPAAKTEAVEEESEPKSDFDTKMVDENIASDDMDVAASSMQDDILEEADVYISYGLHQQAQDLLTEAISNEPNRNDFKVKLAEVFYNQGNQQAFDQHAKDVKVLLGEASSEWQKIVEMGKELSPDNEDYGRGDPQKETVQANEESQNANEAPVIDEDLEDTVIDNRDKSSDSILEFNEDDMASPDSFKDDPVASKIMSANENPNILDFEADDFENENAEGLDSAAEATSTGVHKATGLHENIANNELTEELDEVSMHTTMEDLSPLDLDDVSKNTVVLEADETANDSIGTNHTLADPDETSAYIAADDTEQFDTSGVETEFLDPGEDTVAQSATDLHELGPPSLIEEIGTKLDLAKAFVDMGDSDAAKETLIEVINEGDESQIRAAKDLMDKLSG